jgi:drug/metabolite transporter (DMT)-like permease
MKTNDLLRLILLGAIWGGSFFFMRMVSPVLGAAYVAEGRVLAAALFLAMLSVYWGRKLQVRQRATHYLIMGFFNSALPFMLFAYASLELSTAELSILNAMAPVWGFLIGWLRGSEILSVKRAMGLLLGVVGVAILLGLFSVDHHQANGLSVAMGLIASLSYGVASNYAKVSKGIEPFDNTHGSLWASVVLILPALFCLPMKSQPTLITLSITAVMGVVCTAVALLLYFRLIQDVGATSALTVTYLIPLFASLWGVLFLDETLSANTLLGMVVIILGTAWATEFDWRVALGLNVQRDQCAGLENTMRSEQDTDFKNR